jgi:hypothetical protein
VPLQEPGEFNLVRKQLHVTSLSVSLLTTAKSQPQPAAPPAENAVVFQGVNARVRLQLLLDRTITNLPRNRIDCLFDDFSAKLTDQQFSSIVDIVGSLSPENPRESQHHVTSPTRAVRTPPAPSRTLTKPSTKTTTTTTTTTAAAAVTAASANDNGSGGGWFSWIAALVEEETVEEFDDLLVRPRLAATTVLSVYVNHLTLELFCVHHTTPLATAHLTRVGLEIVLPAAAAPSVFVGVDALLLSSDRQRQASTPCIAIDADHARAASSAPQFIAWSLFDPRMIYDAAPTVEPDDMALASAAASRLMANNWPSDAVDNAKWTDTTQFSALNLEFHSTEWASVEALRAIGSSKQKPSTHKRLKLSTAPVSLTFTFDFIMSLLAFLLYDDASASSSSAASATSSSNNKNFSPSSSSIGSALRHRWLHSPPVQLGMHRRPMHYAMRNLVTPTFFVCCRHCHGFAANDLVRRQEPAAACAVVRTARRRHSCLQCHRCLVSCIGHCANVRALCVQYHLCHTATRANRHVRCATDNCCHPSIVVHLRAI